MCIRDRAKPTKKYHSAGSTSTSVACQARNAGQDGRASTASGSSQTTYCGECTLLVSMNPTKARKYSCGSRGRRGARSASTTTAAMVSNRPANTAALSRPGAPSIGPTRSSACPVTCCSTNHSESQLAGRVRFKSTNRSSAFAPPPRCGARAAIKAPGPPASNCDHALGATATNAPSGPGAFMAALAPHRGGGANALLRFVDLNRTRPANWDSLWFVLQHVTGHALDRVGPIDGAPGRLNAAVFAGLLLTMAAVVVLALRAPRRPRLPQLYFLALVGFMLTNKVHSPQYVVWLLPLAVLARPSWPAFLAWQATEVLLLPARMYFFVGLAHPGPYPGAGLPEGWFLLAVLARDAAMLSFAALVVRDICAPERDRVRAVDVDDPAGGPLDGAPDRLRLPGWLARSPS